MIDYFLKFRSSNYWYLFILIFIVVIILLLARLKNKSTHTSRRLSNIIILTLGISWVLLSLILFVMLITFGFSKDFFANYTDVLLIVGPICIFSLIVYALIKEKKIK